MKGQGLTKSPAPSSGVERLKGSQLRSRRALGSISVGFCLDSERGNFKPFGLIYIYKLYRRKVELFGARLLKKRVLPDNINPKPLSLKLKSSLLSRVGTADSFLGSGAFLGGGAGHGRFVAQVMQQKELHNSSYLLVNTENVPEA